MASRTAVENLGRLNAALDDLSLDDARSVTNFMIGFVSDRVDPDPWDKGIAAALEAVRGLRESAS